MLVLVRVGLRSWRSKASWSCTTSSSNTSDRLSDVSSTTTTRPPQQRRQKLRPLPTKRTLHHSSPAAFLLEVHRLLANNRYRAFDNRHRPIIGRLFVLVSKTTKKMLLTAVHIDDNEVTNDSVISHVSSSTANGLGWAVTKNYKLVKLRQECYQSTIVPLWLHNRYNMTFIERRCVLK